MRWIKAVASEIFDLFVDDGSFAGAILAWLLLAWLGQVWLPPGWAAAGLFLGLAAIFIESATRRARQIPSTAKSSP